MSKNSLEKAIEDQEQMLLQMEMKMPPTHSFGKKVTKRIKMTDKVELATDIYFPDGEGPWPVILERSPYPQLNTMREMASKAFVKYGYVVVSQDCRGKGRSSGEWVPFENERSDGLDTIDWIIEQPWMNGNIAMYGMSYGGFEQWIVADELPKEVKTLFIGVFGTERHRQMYMNGMFRHEIYTSWAIENAGISTNQDLGELYQQAIRHRPHINMDVDVSGVKLPWYREWISTPNSNSDFWTHGIWNTLKQIPAKVNVPLYMVGGWYDHHLDGMFCAYQNLNEAIKQKSKFVVGPWIHNLKPGGELPCECEDYNSVEEAVKWFDLYLKDNAEDNHSGSLDAFVMNGNAWIDLNDIAVENKQYFFLNGDGDNEVLTLANAQKEKGEISFLYDPRNPVMTNGGEALLAWISPGFNGCKPGSLLQGKPLERNDVLTLTSDVCEEDKLINGEISVHLSISTNVSDTSFAVKINEVFSDGRTFNIRDGISSICYRNQAEECKEYVPGSVVDLEIKLWPIVWKIQKGSCIRLDITSSNFPAYHVHSNTRENWAQQDHVEIAKQIIYTGEESNSYVEMPFSQIK